MSVFFTPDGTHNLAFFALLTHLLFWFSHSCVSERWSPRLATAANVEQDLFAHMWITRCLLGGALLACENVGFSLRAVPVGGGIGSPSSATALVEISHFLVAFRALALRYRIV